MIARACRTFSPGLPKQGLEYFRSDAGDVAVVQSWVNNLDLRKVFPVVAVLDGTIVGDATLHFGATTSGTEAGCGSTWITPVVIEASGHSCCTT